MTLLIISLVLLIIAAVGKAVMDTLRFHFLTSFFAKYWKNTWVNPDVSWKNKWKNGDPAQGEAFPGSSTIFVFVTDFWHLSQFIYLRCIFAVIILFPAQDALSFLPGMATWLWYMIAYVGLSAIFGLTFTLFYSKLSKT